MELFFDDESGKKEQRFNKNGKLRPDPIKFDLSSGIG